MENVKELLEKYTVPSITADVVNKATSVCIVGRRGSGKTSLAYHLLSMANKPVYVFKHPTPELIERLGYHAMYSLEEMEDLQECFIWIDEPQVYLKKYEGRGNEALERMLSIARHRSITLILSTSDTRFVNKGLESYVDLWFIKDIETDLIKQGSLAKKIIKRNCIVDANGFRLTPSKYLFYARDHPRLEGIHAFPQPAFFNLDYSKPFRKVPEERVDEVVAELAMGVGQ